MLNLSFKIITLQRYGYYLTSLKLDYKNISTVWWFNLEDFNEFNEHCCTIPTYEFV